MSWVLVVILSSAYPVGSVPTSVSSIPEESYELCEKASDRIKKTAERFPGIVLRTVCVQSRST